LKWYEPVHDLVLELVKRGAPSKAVRDFGRVFQHCLNRGKDSGPVFVAARSPHVPREQQEDGHRRPRI